MDKKEISTFLPNRNKDIEEVAERILSVIGKYGVSALDYLEIIEYVKKEGLKHFKL